MWLGLCSFLILTSLSPAKNLRYDNYRVYKASAKNLAQLRVLQQLEDSNDSIIFLNDVRFVGDKLHIAVAPHKLHVFLATLNNATLKYTLKVEDLQKHIDEKQNNAVGSDKSSKYNWLKYYKLEETYSWLQSLSMQHPESVTLIELGKSYQGRSILGIKISKSLSEKPGIFIEAGMHAREWITSAAATYIINQLLNSKEQSIQQLANNYNWYVFPHVNPDGYVYTHTTNRFWRKTLKSYGSCFGADPNRNWDYHWSKTGASNNRCSAVYAGPAPFSEIETLSLAKYIMSIKDKIQLYISLHAFGQLLLYPYGHTSVLPDNVNDYKQVFDAAIAAIRKRYGTNYTGGNIYKAVYPTSGDSVDWVFSTQNVRMAFCYELRPPADNNVDGLQLPTKQIVPASEELLDSITAMVDKVNELGYFRKNFSSLV